MYAFDLYVLKSKVKVFLFFMNVHFLIKGKASLLTAIGDFNKTLPAEDCF